MQKIVLQLDGLNCASCAGKIEQLVGGLEGVENTSLDFVTKKLRIEIAEKNDKKEIINNIEDIIKRLEPDVVVRDSSIADKKLDKEDGEESKRKEYFNIWRIIISGLLFLSAYLFKLEDASRLLIFLASYIIIGYKVIIIAFKNILAGVPFDENFLMTVATVGAFIIGEYPEGVAVMLFYNVGELFQDKAVNHSRNSIKALMDIRPDSANLVLKDDSIRVVSPLDVHIGDYVIIKPGEKVPLDGVVVEGESSLDTSNITGESLPRKIKAGEDIVSGVVNNHGLLKVKVTKEFGESTISKILDLVENASSKKAKTENFITKFAKYYTPLVVFVALGIGLIPTLLGIGQPREWAYRAFVFLVISCPCALVISIPLGFFGGIGAASKNGILIKGGNYLEALNDVDTLVFDKTGTITKGTFKVTDILSYDGYSKDEILEIAALGESFSNHPIAKSILDYYQGRLDKSRVENYKEIPGGGISVDIDGENISLGNKRLLEKENIEVIVSESIGTLIYIGKDKRHIGTIIVSDELKEGIKEILIDLKRNKGIKQTIMLSGDNEETANKVASLAGIDQSFGNLLPIDKVNLLEAIMDKSKDKKKTIFIGDGVNDAPVLARADIGIAMGGLGSDAAIEASDIVIMNDEICKISTAMKIAKKTKKIVTQNIILALALKLVVLGLGAFGLATMWQAVFADVGVTIIAVLNSIRTLKVEA